MAKRPAPDGPSDSSNRLGASLLEAASSGDGINIEMLRTPCYVAYKGVVESNAARMHSIAKRQKCALRPHMKTHKTIEGGIIATGGSKERIAVSTLAEAEFFAAAGFDDILYAVPITGAKLGVAAALTGRLRSFYITLDCEQALSEVLEAPQPLAPDGKPKPWKIVVMVDCGYGRDGIDPKDVSSIDLIHRIVAASPRGHAEFAGLYTHGGHSYDAEGTASEARQIVRGIAAEERAAVAEFASLLKERGVKVPIVGVGSTPTCSNPPIDGLLGDYGVTEMHPGNYIYYDVMQEKLGSCVEEEIAVRVVTRVIGHYCKKNLLLVDMGWTACSKQGQECGFGRIEGHEELKVFNLKQEAGLITSSTGDALDFAKYPLGMLLRLEPYHSCAHTKQHDRVHVLGEDRRTVTDVWQICHGW